MDQATLVGMGIGLLLAVVVIGGFASNAPTVSPAELASWLDAAEPPVVVDLRSRGDYADGHIRGAVHVPLADAFGHEGLAVADDQRVVLCSDGALAARIAKIGLGFSGVPNLHYLDGDVEAWRAAGLPFSRD